MLEVNSGVLVLSGCGLNCEEETLMAFQLVGICGKIVHINDIINSQEMIKDFSIFVIPGGFSYGDYLGAGKILSIKLAKNILRILLEFIENGKLVLGICNGCQILVNLLPEFSEFILEENKSGLYQCEWVDVNVENSGPWLKGIRKLHLPIAHGEGRFSFRNNNCNNIEKYIAMKYDLTTSVNPNGSLQEIAAITAYNGNVLAMMPHPERAVFAHQIDDWYDIKTSGNVKWNDFADGISIFKNVARYFGL